MVKLLLLQHVLLFALHSALLFPRILLREPTHETHNTIFIGIKPIMSYVTATLTQLASLPIVTITGRGKRITQAIDVSQMIVKRMNEVGYEIGDVRISSDSLVSRDGKKRNVSKIEIDLKNSSSN